MHQLPWYSALLLASLPATVLAQGAPLGSEPSPTDSAPSADSVAAEARGSQAQLYPKYDTTVDPRDPFPARRWYGWQTLLLDGAAIALTVGGAGLDGNDAAQTPALGLALGTYLAGGPVVHLLHGHPGKAALSLGLRVGVPVTAGAIAAAATQCKPELDGEACGMGTVIATIGSAALGAVVASIIDGTAIARDPVPNAPSVSPVVQVGKNGGVVGLAGRF